MNVSTKKVAFCNNCGSLIGAFPTDSPMPSLCYYCDKASSNSEIDSIGMNVNSVSGLAKDQKHYQFADVQPIEIMQMYLSRDELIGWLKGNILKYTLRMGHKDSVCIEADKINQYATWLAIVIDGGKISPAD